MRIALDAMGGDEAPTSNVAGAISYLESYPNHTILLVGDETVLKSEVDRLAPPQAVRKGLEIVHASEVVDMDEPPITPIRKKRDASVRVAATAVREGDAAAMVSAGNTGAAMICAKMVIGTSPGVDRPALCAVLPNRKGHTVLLDVGANVDSKPEQLRQFAVMGHFFSQELQSSQRPRIGLLSIGEEQGKGTDTIKETFGVLERTGVNFIGNVEGGDVFSGDVDVVVCDGFVGNVLLKSAESLASMVAEMLREEIDGRLLSRLGMLVALPSVNKFKTRVDYSEIGGAPLLGLKGACFIAHGRSSPKAIRNAIRGAVEFTEHGTSEKISKKLEEVAKVIEQAPAAETA